MKTREQVLEEVLALDKKYLMLALPTGFGKTKTALDVTYKHAADKVLVVYPKLNLEQTWKDEYKKWGYEERLKTVTFTTYASIGKHATGHWDMIIFDEGHHITDRVLDIIKVMSYDRALILSATVKANLKYRLELLMPGLKVLNVRLKQAIDDEVLPEPKIILMPLQLDNTKITEQIVKNPKATGGIVEVPYNKRFFCKDNTKKYLIKCTEAQYLADLNQQVEWYKSKAARSAAMKNTWLHKAGVRLKWLADKKTLIVAMLLKQLYEERTLTFCSSIVQTEKLGKHCIHSKNKQALQTLQQFNDGQIDHITACAMLDEGVNLVNCRVSIFANINASERIQIQRVGRSLRHKDPVIIIPYFNNTREKEIVDQMLLGYDAKFIYSANSLGEVLKFLNHGDKN